MRVVRFKDDVDATHWGCETSDGKVVPIQGDLFGGHAADDAVPTRAVRRVAPATPPNIIAIGRNYVEHAHEVDGAGALTEPLVFLKATTSVVGPDDAIVLPRSAPDEVDFEGELAVIIGTLARNVGEGCALDYVFGYTCANDVTARDCQKRRDKQWARGKSFDTFCPLGPVIVTRDEFDPTSVAIRSILNGQVMQDGNTKDMIFSVPSLVSYLSHQFTLLPGTVILTGTPAGVGYAREPQIFLREGDEISVEIAGIGRLTNRVVC